MFKKLKEKKGFTLVELIVVLVILAILAALLIPALTKYIDKAKNKSIVAETRQAVMAAQTLVDEKYAKEEVGADNIGIAGGSIAAALNLIIGMFPGIAVIIVGPLFFIAAHTVNMLITLLGA